MKNISDIVKEYSNIKEGLKINKNIKIKNKENLNFHDLKEEILTLYDLTEEDFQKFYDAWSIYTSCNIKKYNFKLILQNNDNKELFNFGADLINHPSRFTKYVSFDHIYTNEKRDLRILYHYNDDLGDFLYFLDYENDTYKIYQMIK